jgi:hypothetical protein
MTPITITLNATTTVTIADVSQKRFRVPDLFGYKYVTHTMLHVLLERVNTKGKTVKTYRALRIINFIDLLKDRYGIKVDEDSLVEKVNDALGLFRDAVKTHVADAVEDALQALQ